MKRRLFKLVVFLLLGAIVNVGVAWGLALWPRYAVILTGNEPQILLAEDIAWWNAHVKPQYGCDVGDGFLTRDFGIQGVFLFGPSAAGGNPYYVEAIRLSSGWPSHAFAGDGWTQINPQPPFPQWQTDDAMIFRQLGFMIPLRPIWLGFTINTIFYASLVWCITLGPFTARRIIRRKRGQCIKCGYDLRGDFTAGCPECGWRRDDVS